MSRKDKLLENELNWITEELMSSLEEDEHGIFWKTLHRQPYGALYSQVNEEIYNGVSGITQFFISLYQHKKEIRHLEIADKSISWCIHYIKNTRQKHYTFYTGAVGVIYSLIKIYEATDNRDYLNVANELFTDLEQGITEEVTIDDLLSGNAGNLFVITYLYCHTRRSNQYRMVRLLIDKIIANAKISKRGLKWGYLNNALDSTTGMSHGASGIAHVLLEVARVLDYPELNWIAEQAFAFEDEYYSGFFASWIDMRILHSDAVDQAIRDQGTSFYLKNKRDVNAWAHGITGMALARLNAYKLLKKKYYKKILYQSVKITLSDIGREADFMNFTLSTGLGSWLELLMHAGRMLRKPRFRKEAVNFILKAAESRNRMGLYGSGWYADKSDPAFMVGTAGIGYLYLQLLNKQTDSLLLPKINSGIQIPFKPKIKLPSIKKKIYGKYLMRTRFILNQIRPDLNILSDVIQKNNIGSICKEIREMIKNLPQQQQQLVQDVFKLEFLGIEMYTNADYNIYREQNQHYFKRLLQKAEGLEDRDFFEMNFIISGHVKILKTKWRWPINQPKVWKANNWDEAGRHYVIMRLEIDRLEEFYPNLFSGILLNALKRQQSFKDLLQLLERKFDLDQELLREKLVQQLKSFIRQWFIEIKYAGLDRPA